MKWSLSKGWTNMFGYVFYVRGMGLAGNSEPDATNIARRTQSHARRSNE